MADAWTLLIAESSLLEQGHDAWEHLESTKAGGSGTVFVSDIEVEMESLCFEVEISEDFEVEMGSLNFEVEIEDQEYEVEVCI